LHGGGFSDYGSFSGVVPSAPPLVHGSIIIENLLTIERFDMGAFWNPHGGVVLSDKKLSKNEVAHLKREWLAQHHGSVGPVVKWWKKFKMAINLFSPLK
jgi:hypothetical protein